MSKPNDAAPQSGLLIGSEPLDGTRDKSAYGMTDTDKDKKDSLLGDRGDDDSTDSDKSDSDMTDKGNDDSRDSDGKD